MMRRVWPCLLLLPLLWGIAVLAAQPAETTADAPEARVTEYPAGPNPDEVLLTWADDPSTSISIQWRTNTAVTAGSVAYMPRAAFHTFSPAQPTIVQASCERLEDQGLTNDPVVNWHTVQLHDLKPDTDYVYAVADGTPKGWGEVHSFHTAPARAEPFCFVYFGDAQNGFSRWGALQQAAARARPDAAFFLMAGDLVNRGNDRDNWDDLLIHGSGVYCQKPVVPCVGNHECIGNGPEMYRRIFDLPLNGPPGVESERAYTLSYGNALFVVLDSNLAPETEAPWLERQLAELKAVWKFVMFHHPLYSSRGDRDNKEVRETWGPIFDKHHVDVVFQGHDHAYLRTYPMKGNRPVASPAEGTIYLISVSGTKMYVQDPHDYTEVGFTNTATFSTIDILPATEMGAKDRLSYVAYDLDGKIRDQFAIEK